MVAPALNAIGSDLFTAEERGKAISIYSLAPPIGTSGWTDSGWVYLGKHDLALGVLRNHYRGRCDSSVGLSLPPRDLPTCTPRPQKIGNAEVYRQHIWPTCMV